MDTGVASAAKNMAIDAELLENVHQSPLLHLYQWERPSATYGYFIDPLKYLKPEAIEKVQLARRPTGGGIVFHVTDFAFSIVIPSHHAGYSLNTLENYAYVNQIVMDVVRTFIGKETLPELLQQAPPPLDGASHHFCMANPTKYDVMIAGKKVGGAAQRRTKDAFLHQGTIALAIPDENFLNGLLLPNTHVWDSMVKNTYSLLPVCYSREQLKKTRDEISALMMQAIKKLS